jgi:antitoxin component YwqK of YwqJK toxin-antitoxin module
MKTQILIFSFMMIRLISISQQVKKTYYDYGRTSIKEEFQINAMGEKHGWYKSYNGSGIIVEKATFKNGELDGLYQFFNTETGKAILSREAHYKNNLKQGLYKSYSIDAYHIVEEQGNYVNDVKEGLWFTIIKIPDEDTPGYSFSKTTYTFEGGNNLGNSNKWYYHPSGKLYKEVISKNDLLIAQEYYPEGKLMLQEYLSQRGSTDSTKTFYTNGKLRKEYFWGYINNIQYEKDIRYNFDGSLLQKVIKVDGVLTEYAGYNEDGSKDDFMIKFETAREKKKKE